MKIDLHIHLEERPYRYAYHLTLQGYELGLDGICLVEHNRWTPPPYWQELQRNTKIPVFWAVEYSASEGHILIFESEPFSEDPASHPFNSPGLAMQNLIDWVQQKGGIAIPVHPYTSKHYKQLGDRVQDLKNLIAIETINGSLAREDNLKAEQTRTRLHIKGIGGSDAHNPYFTGKAYTVFRDPIKTQPELLKALRDGPYSPEYR